MGLGLTSLNKSLPNIRSPLEGAPAAPSKASAAHHLCVAIKQQCGQR